MFFWIYMLAMDLLIPVTMIFFGRYFTKSAPKNINMLFGYRTAMSMTNRDTWDFAHRHCGKLWFYLGITMLPCTVLAMLPVLGRGYDTIGIVGGIISLLQILSMIFTIISTERALKRTFDSNGIRKQPK